MRLIWLWYAPFVNHFRRQNGLSALPGSAFYNILSTTPLGGCFINCGWGTGGFKAIPGSGWAMAELIHKGAPGALAAEFGLDRFRQGRFIDESVAAGVAH